MAGRKAAGIGFVEGDGEARGLERRLGDIGHRRRRGGTETIAEHHVGRLVAVAGSELGRQLPRRHRMAIDQQAAAEPLLGRLQQPLQGLVVGPVKGLDAAKGVFEPERFVIDVLAVGDHPGDGAEPGGDPRRAGVDVIGQRVGEHRRVELESLAVGVYVGAGKAGAQKRRAEIGGGGENFVNEDIFRTPQTDHVEPRRGDELGRVIAPGMGRGKDYRRRLFSRCQQPPGRTRAPVVICLSSGEGSLRAVVGCGQDRLPWSDSGPGAVTGPGNGVRDLYPRPRRLAKSAGRR